MRLKNQVVLSAAAAGCSEGSWSSVSAYAASEECVMDTGADKTGVRGPAGHQYLSTHDHAHSLPHHQLPRDHQLSPGDQGDGQPHRDPGPGHGAQSWGGSGQPRHRVQRLVCVPSHPQPPCCELFLCPVSGTRIFRGFCLQVNKLHCGSVITFYDNSASADATVAVDVCLTALILAKVDTRYR